MADMNEINPNEVLVGKIKKPTHKIMYTVLVVVAAFIVTAVLVLALRKGNKTSYGVNQTQQFAAGNSLSTPPGNLGTYKIDVLSKGSGEVVNNEKSLVDVVFRIFDPVTGKLLNSVYSTAPRRYIRYIYAIPPAMRTGLVGNSNGANINYYIPPGQTRELERELLLYEDYSNGMVIELKIVNVTNK